MNSKDRHSRQRHSDEGPPFIVVPPRGARSEDSPVMLRNRAIISATLGAKLPEVMGALLRTPHIETTAEEEIQALIRKELGKQPEDEIPISNPLNTPPIKLDFLAFARIARFEAFQTPDYWRGEIERIRAERRQAPPVETP